MHIAVDISLYPLSQQYIPPIQDFIRRLNGQPGLRVETNALSTHVSGDIDRVFEALRVEVGRTFSELGRAVFVMKVLGGGD